MHRTVWAGLILFLAGAHGAAFAEEWNKTFAVSGRPELRVDTNDGDVSVRTADVKQIEARVSTVGWKIGPSDVRVSDHQTGDRVELEVRIPRRHFNLDWGRRSVKIELQVPRETRADIHTDDGNISAEGLRGETRLHTRDGRIEANALDGALEARSGDGRINIRGRLDLLNVRTGDGSIEAEVAPGSKMASSWRVESGDGHVRLRLPEGFAADLDAHTGDGRITVDFPVTVSGTLGQSDVRGKMNGGGPTLSVRTGDGSIRLERL